MLSAPPPAGNNTNITSVAGAGRPRMVITVIHTEEILLSAQHVLMALILDRFSMQIKGYCFKMYFSWAAVDHVQQVHSLFLRHVSPRLEVDQ